MPNFNLSHGKDFFQIKKEERGHTPSGLAPWIWSLLAEKHQGWKYGITKEIHPQALGFQSSPCCHILRISTKSGGQAEMDIQPMTDVPPPVGKVQKRQMRNFQPPQKDGRWTSQFGHFIENRVAFSLPAWVWELTFLVVTLGIRPKFYLSRLDFFLKSFCPSKLSPLLISFHHNYQGRVQPPTDTLGHNPHSSTERKDQPLKCTGDRRD